MPNMPIEPDHQVKVLFDRLKNFRYPKGVVGTWALVEGPEFFPGGCGLWNARAGEPWPDLEPGCVLFLGHNLDSLDSYRRNLETGGVMRGPTWSNLKKLLEAADVPFDSLFLTNFFMGVGESQTGEFPGTRDGDFVDACSGFLVGTIKLLEPCAVVVLGGHTRQHLARLSPFLGDWASIRTFKELDRQDCAIIPNVTVPGAPPFSVVNIIHPSGATMGGNQGKRRYRGLEGFAAEVALLREAAAGGR